MSKNRLLQIVNRLGLAPKDKTDLVNIIDKGGTGTNENEELDYWNLENAPISLDSNHKIYKHTAEEIIQKGEIIDDLGEKHFNNILFYYTIGTENYLLNIKYITYSKQELLNGIYHSGVNILYNDDDHTLKIIKNDVKYGYICYQPYTYINKLPKIFYEHIGEIPILDSFFDVVNIDLYTSFKVKNIPYLVYINISKKPLLIVDVNTYYIYDITNISSNNIDDCIVGHYYGLNNFCSFNLDNSEYNMTVLSHLDSNQYCSCNIYDENFKHVLCNAEYYNGTITGIKEGKLVQYDVNFETGEITLKRTTDLELIGSEVKLNVCTVGSTEAARNLELLNKAYFALGDHFTVNIDAGIGVAKFIPETGGEGHITTAAGVNVHYTIGNDGSVVKTQEIDIVALYNKVEAMSTNE